MCLFYVLDRIYDENLFHEPDNSVCGAGYRGRYLLMRIRLYKRSHTMSINLRVMSNKQHHKIYLSHLSQVCKVEANFEFVQTLPQKKTHIFTTNYQ